VKIIQLSVDPAAITLKKEEEENTEILAVRRDLKNSQHNFSNGKNTPLFPQKNL